MHHQAPPFLPKRRRGGKQTQVLVALVFDDSRRQIVRPNWCLRLYSGAPHCAVASSSTTCVVLHNTTLTVPVVPDRPLGSTMHAGPDSYRKQEISVNRVIAKTFLRTETEICIALAHVESHIAKEMGGGFFVELGSCSRDLLTDQATPTIRRAKRRRVQLGPRLRMRHILSWKSLRVCIIDKIIALFLICCTRSTTYSITHAKSYYRKSNFGLSPKP